MNPTEIFLRGVWELIPSEEDTTWVDKIAKDQRTDEPLGDYGDLIQEMLRKGVSSDSIARFAKIVAYETAFRLLYHLDDPSASYENFEDVAPELFWSLFLVDNETEAPAARLTCLYESLLSMDPSGREMRPRDPLRKS